MTTDRDLIRRKALVAAGTVVLALGLGACERLDGSYDDDEDESAWGFEDEADDTGLAEADDTGPAEGGCEEEDEALDCTGISDMDEYTACCEDLAAACRLEHPLGGDAYYDCVYGSDFDGSTGCIPWGPPVPPRFRAALA